MSQSESSILDSMSPILDNLRTIAEADLLASAKANLHTIAEASAIDQNQQRYLRVLFVFACTLAFSQ